jgi:hypothetical protein
VAGRGERRGRLIWPPRVLCIPVVDGEASSRANERTSELSDGQTDGRTDGRTNRRARLQSGSSFLDASHLPECCWRRVRVRAPASPVVCIPASRAARMDGKAFGERGSSSLTRTRGRRLLGSTPLRSPEFPVDARGITAR